MDKDAFAAEGVADGNGETKTKRKKRAFPKYFKNNWGMYLILLPGMATLLIFTYIPMFGLYYGFVDYTPSVPFYQLEFVGRLNFRLIFTEPLLWKMIRNTLILSWLKILFNFPLTIILSLLIYNMECKWFKNIFQPISYLPNFISWVIISGMMTSFLDSDVGVFNRIIASFGGQPVAWYSSPDKWYAILTVSGIWKGLGWGTIMYVAAMTGIDPCLYEAAQIDGANGLQQTMHVTLPGIAGIISITLVLTMGKIFSDDFEQIYVLVGSNDALSETTSVISTYVYGITQSGTYTAFPEATAMGLIQGVVSLILVTGSNRIAKKMGQETLW